MLEKAAGLHGGVGAVFTGSRYTEPIWPANAEPLRGSTAHLTDVPDDISAHIRKKI